MIHELAYQSIKNNIDFSKRLPDYVFTQKWDVFLFFEAHPAALTSIIEELNETEGSAVVCLIQLSASNDFDANKEQVYSLTSNLDRKLLHATIGPKSPTLGIDIYGAISEKGQWCAYLDCTEEVGILALASMELLNKYESVIKGLRAGNLHKLNKPFPEGSYPFYKIDQEWMQELLKKYHQDYE